MHNKLQNITNLYVAMIPVFMQTLYTNNYYLGGKNGQ